MHEPKPILQLQSVSYVYPNNVKALDNVSLNIFDGDFICLVGPNGSGKSTLAKVIAALTLPSSGSVSAFGIALKDATSAFKIRSNVGYVFQNPDDQLVSSIVEDDVAFGPENLGVSNPSLRTRTDDALRKVGMLEHAKDNVNELSGGQKQRVAIASALAMEPRILILDEPFAMLDSKARHNAMQIISTANNAGCTVIVITHQMDVALSAKRIVAIDNGRIVSDKPPLEFFENQDMLSHLHLRRPPILEICEFLTNQGISIKATRSEHDLEDQLCRLFSTM